MKARVGSSGTLRYFSLAFCVFGVYHLASNFELIRSTPRLSGPMFGSLAQFTFPYACAVGTYLALSAEAMGLYVQERLGSRSAFLRYCSELFGFVLTTSTWILLLGLSVTALDLWLGIPPQVPMRYLLYPIGFLGAGAGIGLAIGRVLMRWTRPRRLSIVLIISFAVGFNLFCIGVFQKSIFGGDDRFTMIVGSRIPLPSEEINPTLLWVHVLMTITAGLLALWLTAMIATARRPRWWRVVLPGIVVFGLVAAAFPLLLHAVGPAPLISPRSASEAECQEADGSRICFWRDERPGAVLLQKALARGRAELRTLNLPTEVSQTGIAEDRRGAVLVADMPSDKKEANYYVAEFVVEIAGCNPKTRSQANVFLRLTEYIASSLSTTNLDFEPSRLTLLETC